jgi:hypothetical protein
VEKVVLKARCAARASGSFDLKVKDRCAERFVTLLRVRGQSKVNFLNVLEHLKI